MWEQSAKEQWEKENKAIVKEYKKYQKLNKNGEQKKVKQKPITLAELAEDAKVTIEKALSTPVEKNGTKLNFDMKKHLKEVARLERLRIKYNLGDNLREGKDFNDFADKQAEKEGKTKYNLTADDYDRYREMYAPDEKRQAFFDAYIALVEDIMESNGFITTRDKSRISDSRYVDVFTKEAYENGGDVLSQIRIADHNTHYFYGYHINLYTTKDVETEIAKLIRTFAEGNYGYDEDVYFQDDMDVSENVVDNFDENAPADAFVRATNGTLAHGYINSDIAEKAGIPTGEIRVYNSLGAKLDNVKSGEKISRREQIKNMGYDNPIDFIHHALSHLVRIQTGSNGSLLMVSDVGMNNTVAIKLVNDGRFYKVTTLMPRRKIDNKNTVWEAAIPLQDKLEHPALVGPNSMDITISQNDNVVKQNEYTAETINIDGVERKTTNSNGERIANTEEGLRNFYKWFGDSKVVDEDGRPLVVYHGTNKKFDTFDKSKIGGAHDKGFYGSGFYFSRNKGEAGSYGSNVMPVYLKIRNPFDLEGVDSGKYSGMDNIFEKGAVLLRNLGLLDDEQLKKLDFYEKTKKEFLNKIEVFPPSENQDVWFGEVESQSGEKILERAWESNNTKDGLIDVLWSKYTRYIKYDDGTYFQNILDGLSFTGFMRDDGYRSNEFTEKLEKLGYDGIYQGDEFVVFNPNQIKSATANNGEFSANTGNIYMQDTAGSKAPRGMTYRMDGKTYIKLFKNANASTFIHESAHWFFNELSDIKDLSAETREMYDKATAWMSATASKRYNVMDKDGKIVVTDKKGRTVYDMNGHGFADVERAWLYAENEMFARGFEQYLKEGKAPNNILQKTFDKFKTWLNHIYGMAKNAMGIEINDSIKEVYAKMLGGEKYADYYFSGLFCII